jgi:argininosuccinate lyase
MNVSEMASQLTGSLTAALTNSRSISGSIKAVLQNFDATIEALDLWAGIISTLQVNKEIMRQKTTDFWALATDLAGAIVREAKLPWRTAHQITAILVRMALEQGKKPADVDTAFVDRAAREYIGEPVNLSNETIREALNPLRAVKARTLFGGTAPAEVKRQIDQCYKRLHQDGETLAGKRAKLTDAAVMLEKTIDSMVGAN